MSSWLTKSRETVLMSRNHAIRRRCYARSRLLQVKIEVAQGVSPGLERCFGSPHACYRGSEVGNVGFCSLQLEARRGQIVGRLS